MVYESRHAGEILDAVLEVGPLNMFDPELVEFALGRITVGDYDPCRQANNVLSCFNLVVRGLWRQ